MAGIMLNMMPKYFDQYNEKCLLVFAKSNYLQYLVTSTFSVAKHSSMFCQFPNCEYHILLESSGSMNDILCKLSLLQFSYIAVDSLYYVFKFFIHAEGLLISNGKSVEFLREAVIYNRTHQYMENRPSVIRKQLLRKKLKKHNPILKKRNAETQTPSRSFHKRISTVSEGPFALDFTQIIDCLLDGNGVIDNERLYFTCK